MSIPVYSKFAPITRGINGSTQPRYNTPTKNFFNSLYQFWQGDLQKEPKWGDNPRERDKWLSWVWKQEPYMAGVLNSVVQIDKNRGWTLTGGRNQVMRFKRVLHNRLFYHPDLIGWRMFTGGMAQSFYTSDLGAVAEVERDTDDGPMTGLYFTDSTECQLTGNYEAPLKLYGDSKVQKWSNNDYFRVVSMPQPETRLHGLGFCAVSRALELIKIMIGIYRYDNEMLLNQAPRGLLLLKGITEQQWNDAMTARQARLQGDEQRYYGAVHVLATLDPTAEIDAQLTALSQLPAEFDQQTFTDLLIYGYSLIFGYDAREFWPVSSGALGTGAETETQHRKAGAKGGLDFVLAYQEKLQGRLPDTIQFEFAERDQDGEMAEALLNQEKVKAITDMYLAQLNGDIKGLVTYEEARSLLAQEGLIPEEWTIPEEDVTIDDEDGVERLLQSERVQRAIYNYPDENIVSYDFLTGQTVTLKKASRIRSKSFIIQRQTEDIDKYVAKLEQLSNSALEGDITQDDFNRQLQILTAAILALSLLNDNDSTAALNVKEISKQVLSNPTIDNQIAAHDLLFNLQLMSDVIDNEEAYIVYEDELTNSELSTLPGDVYAGNYDDNRQGLMDRLQLWGVTAFGVYQLGKMVYNELKRFEWVVGPTEHCNDCQRLNGQVHTGLEWQLSGWRPQSRGLECKGYKCQCRLRETKKETSGGF